MPLALGVLSLREGEGEGESRRRMVVWGALAVGKAALAEGPRGPARRVGCGPAMLSHGRASPRRCA